MTKPTLLRLVPLDIPVEDDMVPSFGVRYRFGLDRRGTLYLTYQHPHEARRLSIIDPHWNPHHGLRYVEWVTSP